MVVVILLNDIFSVAVAGPSNREDSSQPPGELCEVLCHALLGQNSREEAYRDQGERQVLYDVSNGSSGVPVFLFSSDIMIEIFCTTVPLSLLSGDAVKVGSLSPLDL